MINISLDNKQNTNSATGIASHPARQQARHQEKVENVLAGGWGKHGTIIDDGDKKLDFLLSRGGRNLDEQKASNLHLLPVDENSVFA